MVNAICGGDMEAVFEVACAHVP